MYIGNMGGKRWGGERHKSSDKVPLFQARKLIAQRWQAVNPPTISEWTNAVTATVWKEKAVYAKRRNIKEFDQIWKPWLLRIGYSV